MEQPTLAQRLLNAQTVVMFVCRTLSAPVEVWLRRDFGDKYFGIPALFSLFLIPLWGTFFPDHSVVPLMGFWWGYLAMLLVARIDIFRRWRRGDVEHQFYSGRPRLLRLFPQFSEARIKGIVEPALVLLVGLLVERTFSPPLGTFLVVSSLMIAFSIRIAIDADRRRLLQLTDAAFEQRNLAKSFRAVFR